MAKKIWLYSTISSLSDVDACWREYNDTCVCIPLLVNRLQRIWFLCLNDGFCISSITHMLWYSHERMLKTDIQEEKLFYKVVIFVFCAHKKYSHSFMKLRLNHWCHMDYFNDVLTTFLGHKMFQLHCFLWRVRKLSDLMKNILICVPKMNEGLTNLEWHGGWVINDRILIFEWTIPLIPFSVSALPHYIHY